MGHGFTQELGKPGCNQLISVGVPMHASKMAPNQTGTVIWVPTVLTSHFRSIELCRFHTGVLSHVHVPLARRAALTGLKSAARKSTAPGRLAGF